MGSSQREVRYERIPALMEGSGSVGLIAAINKRSGHGYEGECIGKKFGVYMSSVFGAIAKVAAVEAI